MTETLSPLLSDEDEQRLDRILRAQESRDLTLSTAESCTGDRPTLHAERHFPTAERGKARRMAMVAPEV